MNAKNRLFTYLKAKRGQLLLAILFALLFVVAQIAQPFLLGKALDASSPEVNNQNLFNIYIFIALGLVVIGVIFGYLFEVIVMNISQKVIKQARDDVYQKINSISIKDFDMKRHGDIVQLEIRDMENFAMGMFAVFKTLMQGVLTIIITIILMVLVNWILALVVIILTPLSVLMARIVSRFSYKHYKKQSELQALLNASSLETFNNIDIVQSLNYEEASIKTFNEINQKLQKEGRVAQFSASWVNPSTRLVNNIIYVIIGVIGIVMLSNHDALLTVAAVMSIGRLSSFLSYTNQYSKPFNEVSNVVAEFENAKASFKRINDFLNIIDDEDKGKDEIKEIKSIEFKKMSFSYDVDRPLINNFNLKISKGQKVAIVGPTGAGKTTLINLLMRFYNPNKGSILINKKPYEEIRKESLRNKVGMVLQDTWIFKGTILDNIRYFKKDASQKEVREAAKKAHADIFINTLPNGYLTEVSNKHGLSEGQRQMIAIARIMLLNPELVILDEATSNIDTRSEKLITDAFDLMMKEKTSIVIAHRLSTIEKADIIIVMRDGKIVETGNHADLMKKQGFYYELYSSQYK